MRTVTLALLVPLGCSWIFVQEPPAADPLPGQPVECTDSNFYPAADIAGAGGFGVISFSTLLASLLVAALANEDEDREQAQGLLVAGLGTGAAAGLYLWSAIDGALDTSRCREIRLRREAPPPALK